MAGRREVLDDMKVERKLRGLSTSFCFLDLVVDAVDTTRFVQSLKCYEKVSFHTVNGALIPPSF